MHYFILPYFWFLFIIDGCAQPFRCRNLLNCCFSINTLECDLEYPTPPDPVWPFEMDFANKYDSRLPKKTSPVEYWLNITPNLLTGTFDADVTIEIVINEDTKEIVMHAEGLNIIGVVVTGDESSTGRSAAKSPRRIKTLYEPVDEGKDVLTIKTDVVLSAKRHYKVKIVFTGYLYENNPFGFALYHDKHGDENSSYRTSKYFMAETFFIPFFARRVFPCYDSIEYKTPFTITVTYNSGETVISNVPRFSANNTTSSKPSVTFKTIGSISTYMIYLAILGKAYVRNSTGRCFVYTTEEFASRATFAASVFERLVEEMKRFSAQDLRVTDIVLPIRTGNDNLFTLSYLKKNFMSEANSALSYLMELTKGIAFYVARNWFDKHLVIDTWNDFWLKDGLGFYLSFKLLSTMKLDWRMPDVHGSLIMQSALYHDRRYFFYPLTRADSDNTKEHLFDVIHSPKMFKFYNNKASLIFRMLEYIVGPLVLQEAIQTVKRANAGSVLTPKILWNTVQKVAEANGVELNIPDSRPLSNVMDGFTTQIGYPLLTTTLNNYGRVDVEQEPYMYSSEENRIIWTNFEWIVPITMTTESETDFENTRPIAWSEARKKITLKKRVRRNEWYILGLKNSAYARVNYEKENWKLLIRQLLTHYREIHPLNRVQLIADSHLLAADGKLSVSIPIQLLTYIRNENDPIVWQAALDQFKKFYTILRKDYRQLYKEYFVTCLKYQYKRVGFKVAKNDDTSTKIWKSNMLDFLCHIGDEDCINMARKEYTAVNGDLTKIDPNLQSVVLCTMLRGDDAENIRVALKEKIIAMGPSVRTKINLLHTVEETIGCEYLPYDDTIRDALIEMVIYNIINGDEYSASRLKGILSLWDTTSAVLRVIENIILKWGEKNCNHDNGVTDKERKGMTTLLSFLQGKMLGKAEADMIRNIRFVANIALAGNPSYRELLNTLKTVEQSIMPMNDNFNETMFKMSVKSYSCDPAKLHPFSVAIPRGDNLYEAALDPRPITSDRDYDPLDEFWAALTPEHSPVSKRHGSMRSFLSES